MDEEEARQLAIMAIGRLFKIASRPFQAGDTETYSACRTALLDASEAVGMDIIVPDRSWAATRLSGAQGDS